jgi:chemotaxis methyl-accepting protein methylase
MELCRNHSQQVQEFEAFLIYLKQSRGFDFSVYQRSHLQQRLGKRLKVLHIKRVGDYWDYLKEEPDEFTQLLNELLIQATAFFRDIDAWTYLSETIIPRLVASIDDQPHFRLWSAGCASGEEAYTLAMVMAEALGLAAFRRQVRIFATDVDDQALLRARRSEYSATALQSLPMGFRDKYFEPVKSHFVIRPELRHSVIFGRHNLVLDAPMSHLNLLVCRNTLMYFSPETQIDILSRFCFALKDTAILFLGKAETPFPQASLFAPLHLKHRLFAKVPSVTRQRPLRHIDAEVHRELREPSIDQRQSELIYTKLQYSLEEIEMRNEELQASYEDIAVTNEELHATNEELTTMNDELQASNIILQQFKADLQKRDEEFNRLLTWVRSVLASLPMAVIVIDPTFVIRMWNPQASKLWGLEPHQAEGQSLLHLDIGLPVKALAGQVRSILAGQSVHEEIILDARHRLGQPIQCRITCTPLLGTERDLQGSTLLIEVNEKHG